MPKKDTKEEIEEKKELYGYQQGAIDDIFNKIENSPENHHLLYQLPTGGGKTVIFSEITRKYLERYNKKVVVLTHRIELCKQTSKMLNGFNVKNKIINSNVKDLVDQDDFSCFVAMVETLNNRLIDEKFKIDNVGLLIIDEAHFNSFRKLFSSFKNTFFLGVTATPLSSNIKLPMFKNYNELLVGQSISSLIDEGYLAKAVTYNYDVGLSSLKIGVNGDYTVKSSDELYTNLAMQEKLIHAYKYHAYNKKTLIFNNGIKTSLNVLEVFKQSNIHNVRHLDNTHSNEERKQILRWFKHTPNAILTSVGILTTGFDEPTVENIILNRATKSLALYFQMIGRGSRKLPNKNEFTILDLGNNAARFGLWTNPVDWHYIFKHPEQFLERLKDDVEIERQFTYKMPPEVRVLFCKTLEIDFDVEVEYKLALSKNHRPITVIDKSVEQHAKMCIENTKNLYEAKQLAKMLHEDIESRARHYTYSLSNSTKNYLDWLIESYKTKLSLAVGKKYRESIFED